MMNNTSIFNDQITNLRWVNEVFKVLNISLCLLEINRFLIWIIDNQIILNIDIIFFTKLSNSFCVELAEKMLSVIFAVELEL